YSTYADEGENVKIDLSMNFRSRKNILDSANFIFRQIMNKQTCQIKYDKDAMLYNGATYPENNGILDDSTELIIVETKASEKDGFDGEIEDLSSAEQEARAIARKINELVNGENPQYVFDKNTESYRKAEFGDITILLRSLTDAQTLVHELSLFGIPANANITGGYFGNIEVLVILSLLRIIDNPLQDIDLIAVLHSPIYEINADTLAKIRSFNSESSFYSAIQAYLENDRNKQDLAFERVQRFMDNLAKWRSIRSQVPVSRLISILYDETGYFDYLALMPRAEIMQANLMALFEHALNFEKSSLQGIFRFVKYVEKLIEKDAHIKDAGALITGGNIVQIMTIHKSKGLEFPICFVSNLGKKINRRDEYAQLIMHRDYGFGPIFISEEPRIRSNTLPRCVLADKIHNENYGEELRILYVALTRAKDKLILTGTVGDYEKMLVKWLKTVYYEDESLPAQLVFDSQNYMNFIGSCLVRHKDFSIDDIVDRKKINGGLYGDSSSWKITVVGGDEEISPPIFEDTAVSNEEKALDTQLYESYYKEISSSFSWQYGNLNETLLPTKISISEIKRNYFSRKKYESDSDIIEFSEPTFDVPDFIDKNRKLSSAEKGTAMHTLMEHLDVNKINTKEDIETLVKRLLEMNLLSENEAKSINTGKIYNFTSSNLGERMRRAEELKKEVPFVIELDAKDAYLPNLSEGSLLVHGIIDCYFIENGRIILVDYKSDYVGDIGVDGIKERYKIQLSIYKKALEQALGLNVYECLLYLFDIDDYVNMFD
ncbi:PD-(D/E)XK nuclease family protein, partial [Tyzzerella sp. OttesenSCG-928-J15]|nr:PD-(D/E)XK nuclease family protein [Tyzzerella sp. OttesenSCG-928-J15]